MEVELPGEIWVHAGCYEGLDGEPVCDRRWFVGQINPDDVKYIRAKLNPKRTVATVAKMLVDDKTIPDGANVAAVLLQWLQAGGAKPYEVEE